jgi:hypothetical protein
VTRRRILLPLAPAIIALAAGGACQRGDDRSPATSTTATETTAPAGSAELDVVTVTRVLADLDRVQGDVVRRIVERGGVGHDDLAPLEAIFLEPELSAQAEVFAGLGNRLDEVRVPPGDNRTTVVRLLSARRDCIYAEVSVDVSATVVAPPPPFSSFIALRPLPPGADPDDVNPTPYAIAAKHRVATNPCG